VNKIIKKVLTIAGSDSSGGAGIQADIKTMAAYKVYAMSVITALTAQNTTGVYGILEADPAFVGQQMDCVFSDIFPDAIKIGMVSNIEIIGVIADKLKQYDAKNIILDPVMVSTSGSRLLNSNAEQAILAKLFPLARIITPNIPEAEALSGDVICSQEDMIASAKKISAMLPGGVLIKGGHFSDTADDLLYADHKAIWVRGDRIENPNTHGTGCTLSSAIACNLAFGLDLEESVREAKRYITGALSAGLDLGNGRGPLDHMYAFRENT
jgi:hydroxymethylpyrimidine/phosphomethylpyrimidine kinase